jgi:hypothetical protein
MAAGSQEFSLELVSVYFSAQVSVFILYSCGIHDWPSLYIQDHDLNSTVTYKWMNQCHRPVHVLVCVQLVGLCFTTMLCLNILSRLGLAVLSDPFQEDMEQAMIWLG